MIIRMTPNKILEMEAILRKLISDHENLNRETRHFIDVLRGEWDGVSVNAVSERLSKFDTADAEKIMLLQELAKLMDNVYKTYTETESSITTQFFKG